MTQFKWPTDIVQQLSREPEGGSAMRVGVDYEQRKQKTLADYEREFRREFRVHHT